MSTRPAAGAAGAPRSPAADTPWRVKASSDRWWLWSLEQHRGWMCIELFSECTNDGKKVYPVCKVSDAGRAESTGHRTAGVDFHPGPDREGPTRTSPPT